MGVIGFSFTSFKAERFRAPDGKLKINNNISIKDIQKKDYTFSNEKATGLKFVVELSVTYDTEHDEKVGFIDIGGEVFYVNDEQKIKDILDAWKKKKNPDKDTMLQVLEASYNRCNIEAVVMAKDIGLPPPIRMPIIEAK